MSQVDVTVEISTKDKSKDCGVYRILNVVDGKMYIGSSKNLKHRWIEHKSDLNLKKHGNIHLQRAWNKYGSGNFVYQIVEYVQENELIDREQWYLDNTKCLHRKCGYNLCPKADRTASGADSAVAKKVYQYDKNGSFIRAWDTVTGVAKDLGLSPDAIGQCARGINRSAGGFQWSFKKKKEIGQYREWRDNRGSKNHKSIPIYQYNLDGTFKNKWDCISEAARELNVHHCAIIQCAKKTKCRNHVQNSCAGFLWSYELYDRCFYEKTKNHNMKYIYQFDISGKLIRRWDSVIDASQSLGLNRSAIIQAKSRKGTSGGFVWKNERI